MTEGEAKHVFISYVREDAAAVDNLCAVLDAAQIPYWRDRTALGPGDAWRAKIRGAVREGSLVFLACFSDNSRAKDKSYMNEELTLAADEFRQMPPGRTWLIPVRFDDGDVPDWDLGAGRVLSDLNYSDLFGPEHMANAARLITTIHRLTGEKRPDAATALAAVEQATTADRTDLLKRLTKEMLLEPSRRIELDDLVSQEVQRVMAVLTDSRRVAGPMTGTNDEQVVRLAEEAQDIWQIARPFCASLQVAARWGSPETLAPWATGMKSFVSAGLRVEGGVEGLRHLRRLPGVVAMMTAGIACTAAGTWANLKTLVVDPSARDGRRPDSWAPLVQATDPNRPFVTDWVSNTLARSAREEKSLTEGLADLTGRVTGKYHTPASDWLHIVLRPLFLDQLPDQDAYDTEFDRAEVILGVLARDVELQHKAAHPNEYIPRTYWFGRSTWRAHHMHGNQVERYQQEVDAQGGMWPPLQWNLFGLDPGRAKAALLDYEADFNRIAHNSF
jgi:hypothetical protein